jgi:tRNA(adenine34) deaminase
VPIGAVLVHNGTIVAEGRNQVETCLDPTAHAEMLVIRQVPHSTVEAPLSLSNFMNTSANASAAASGGVP